MTEIEILRQKHAKEAKESLVPGLPDRQKKAEENLSKNRGKLHETLSAGEKRTFRQDMLKSFRLMKAWYQVNKERI